MATFTNTRAGGTVAGYHGNVGNDIFKHEIDIADALTNNSTATTGDQFAVVTVPADSFFELLQVENATALDLDSGSSQRIDVGDGTDDDEFLTNITTETAGTNHTITKQTFTGGQVISAADTMYLKLTGDKITAGTATGTIRFVFKMHDTARNAPMETITL